LICQAGRATGRGPWRGEHHRVPAQAGRLGHREPDRWPSPVRCR